MQHFSSIVLASLNEHKLAEFSALFAKFDIKVSPPNLWVRNFEKLNTCEVHTLETSYRQNALAKCKPIFFASRLPTLSDDSGIEIDALNGEPGVRSAIFAPKGNLGQDAANRKKVLELLNGKSNRAARFRSVLIFMSEGILLEAHGICEGQIATAESGSFGFGYDSIFIPSGFSKTMAELSSSEKNEISHRANAVKELMHQFKQKKIQLVKP